MILIYFGKVFLTSSQSGELAAKRLSKHCQSDNVKQWQVGQPYSHARLDVLVPK